jgi:hypothetical protein
MAFVNHVKTNLKMPSVRFTGNLDADIKTVAIIGDSYLRFLHLKHHGVLCLLLQIYLHLYL